MPAVFVHGVPDTTKLWDPVLSHLERDDIVTLALPGFASELPAGFDASKEAYLSWLLDSVKRIDGPIDIVGHDWGSLLALRAASLHPELFRTWAGGGGPIDPEYTWHASAQAWRTPGVGEQVMDAMTEETLETGLIEAGVPPENAAQTASCVDSIMKNCILKLFRSAGEIGKQWQADLVNVPRRGLVMWGENDSYVDVAYGRKLAELTGARFVSFPACSHWWPLQRPEAVAAELATLWGDAPA